MSTTVTTRLTLVYTSRGGSRCGGKSRKKLMMMMMIQTVGVVWGGAAEKSESSNVGGGHNRAGGEKMKLHRPLSSFSEPIWPGQDAKSPYGLLCCGQHQHHSFPLLLSIIPLTLFPYSCPHIAHHTGTAFIIIIIKTLRLFFRRDKGQWAMAVDYDKHQSTDPFVGYWTRSHSSCA